MAFTPKVTDLLFVFSPLSPYQRPNNKRMTFFINLSENYLRKFFCISFLSFSRLSFPQSLGCQGKTLYWFYFFLFLPCFLLISLYTPSSTCLTLSNRYVKSSFHQFCFCLDKLKVIVLICHLAFSVTGFTRLIYYT